MPSEFDFDGQTNFVGGQDASKKPDLVPEDAYWSGVNVLCESGYLSPRWGFAKRSLTFPEGGIKIVGVGKPITWKRVFETGKFQGKCFYYIEKRKHALFVISGVIFIIDLESYEVEVIEPPNGDYLDGSADRRHVTVADRFVVIHDWPNYPLIIEGKEARRANPDNDEVPISVLSAFNQSRLFIANAGDEYTAGDPVGSAAAPDAPITFQEFLLLSSDYFGQAFKLPVTSNNPEITAMQFLPMTDSSTGIGVLILSSDRTIFAANAQLPRAQWEQGQFAAPFAAGFGFAGPDSSCVVGQDIWAIDGDGQIRILSMAREESQRGIVVPFSREVKNWVRFWDKSLVRYAAAHYFQNKIFFTVNPYRLRAQEFYPIRKSSDYAHGGMVVMELDAAASMGQAGRFAWSGLWTGVNPITFLSAEEQMFILSKDGNINVLYEVTPETRYDMVDGVKHRVKSSVETRDYDFKAGLSNKDLQTIELNIEEVYGDFNVDVTWKPSHSAQYIPWASFCHKAPYTVCGLPCIEDVPGKAGHNFRELPLGSPRCEEMGSPITKDLYTTFRRIQVRLDLAGDYWELHGIKLHATLASENTTESAVSDMCKKGECPYKAVMLRRPRVRDWAYECWRNEQCQNK